jgi:hypothetical protein
MQPFLYYILLFKNEQGVSGRDLTKGTKEEKDTKRERVFLSEGYAWFYDKITDKNP